MVKKRADRQAHAMSAMERVWFIRDLPTAVASSSAKLVLYTLAARSDKAAKSFASLDLLAANTGLSVRTLRTMLVDLEANQLISRLRRFRKSTVYTLTFESYAAMVAALCGNGCRTEVVQEDAQHRNAAMVAGYEAHNKTLN